MWIIMAWQHISPEVTVKGFKKWCNPMQWMGLMILCYRMTVKRVGMLRNKCE